VEPWPLRHLVLRTPRLELRPDDDASLLELCELALGGVHPPDRMPFLVPWTDAAPEDMVGNIMRYYWGERAACEPGSWGLNFLVRVDGELIGSQGLYAKRFEVTHEVSTGSWLGQRFQRRGFGTEMRAAVLLFAFDHLAAIQARSAAFTDNVNSLRVSEKLGYLPDGSETVVRRGERATETRLLLTRERFDAFRPDWSLAVDGLDGCRTLLLGGTPTNAP